MLGKVFWAGAVAAMGGRDPREVEQALHELARKELVRPSRQSSMEGEAEYGFWHLLVRDVAYQQIPRAQRAAKHLAAAGLARGEGRRARRGPRLPHRRSAHARPGDRRYRARRPRSHPAQPATRCSPGNARLGLDTARALDLLDRAKALTPEEDPAFPLVLLRWAEAARRRRRPFARGRRSARARRSPASTPPATCGTPARRWRSLERPLEPRRAGLDRASPSERSPCSNRLQVRSCRAWRASPAAQFVTGSYAAAIETADRALALAEQLDLAVPGSALGVARLCPLLSR